VVSGWQADPKPFDRSNRINAGPQQRTTSLIGGLPSITADASEDSHRLTPSLTEGGIVRDVKSRHLPSQ